MSGLIGPPPVHNDVVKPMIHMLRIVDSKQPCIVKVYGGMDKIRVDKGNGTQ